MTAIRNREGEPQGLVLMESDRVVAFSPLGGRILRRWTGGTPFSWRLPTSPDMPFGERVNEIWRHAASTLTLLAVSSENEFRVQDEAGAMSSLDALVPRLMGSLSDTSYREGVTALFETVVPDRPLTVLTGEEMRVSGVRGMRMERAEDLRALLSNYHVRKLVRDEGIPLARNGWLVPPVVAMMLGTVPVSESVDGMSNLVICECHDSMERLAGLAIAEYPVDALPDPWQVRLLDRISVWVAELTRRRAIEEQNEQVMQLLESLIEHDPGGIIVLDAGGRIRRVNEAMERITGFRRDELVGRGLDRIFLPDQVRALSDRLQRHEVSTVETEVETVSSALRPVRAQVYPFPNHGAGYVIQLEDLTDAMTLHQKELEVERLQAVFHTAVAFHDKVNTPLSIILAHLERLRYKWADGLSREDLERSLTGIEKQVDRITAIVERMRDMKRYRLSEYGVSDISMVHLSDSQDEDESGPSGTAKPITEEIGPEDR